MKRGAWALQPTMLLGQARERVISARHLMALGVPEGTIYRRCRQDGPWTLLLPGIVALQTGPVTVRQRQIAALLHGGEHAVLTGAGAARLHGVRRLEESPTVHLLVPSGRQAKSVGFVVVERTTRLPRPVSRGGLPVAPLVRALCDQTRRMSDRTAIAALLTDPVQRGLVLAEHLRLELDVGCRKGTSAPRRVVDAALAGVRSPAEYDGRRWWLAQPDLPEAAWNVRILDEGGVLAAVADALVGEVGLVWEIDSVEHHFATAEQVAATARRRRALLALGLYVVHTRPTQHRDDPEGVRRDILQGLAIAAQLPEPRCIYEPDRPAAA